MKWLEIIELRAGRHNEQALEQYLKRLRNDLEKDPNHPEFRIYENRDIESDLSIHLFHSVKRPDQNPSTLSYQIASTLRTFGLVSHTTWKARKSNKLIKSEENE